MVGSDFEPVEHPFGVRQNGTPPVIFALDVPYCPRLEEADLLTLVGILLKRQ
jgi:hypothetical protein